ncbi:MAG: tetratricopeptide repeat protein [Acidobacteriota bacterium]
MEKKILILLMVPLFVFWHWFEPVSKKNIEGIHAYDQKKYSEALERFLSAKGIKPDSAELKNNTASALYNLKKFDLALKEFSAIEPEKSGIRAQDFFYNLGNSYFRMNKFKEALDNYKKSLILNPDDLNAKKNFEITLKKIKEQDKKKKNKDQDKDNREKKKNKNKEKKHKNILKYLNQKEKEQMKKKKRKIESIKNEKDW